LGNKNFEVRKFFSFSIQRIDLCSNEVVEGVISGEIKPKVKDIREEEQKRKKAEAERNQARIAEAKAKADAQAAQQQLFLLEQTSQDEIEALTEQYTTKVQELQIEIKS